VAGEFSAAPSEERQGGSEVGLRGGK